MVSSQMSFAATIALVVGALICLLRLYSLKLHAIYPALSFFLAAEAVANVVSSVLGTKTDLYAIVYVSLLIPEWLIYAFLIREIYSSIFSSYPGIAVVGRWSIYGALVATAAVIGVSVAAARNIFVGQTTVLPVVELSAHCLTLGFAALILIILVSISRYPLDLHANVRTNAIFFSGILLGEAVGLIAEGFTQRRYTTWLNLAVSLNTVAWLAIWPVRLSKEGQIQVVKFRSLNRTDELRLLGQLKSINEILGRVLRTKSDPDFRISLQKR